ncbi:MAG: phosphatase PAP2 family protein [Spirochaetales bacterium]|nr:phosphatase PAP2 family protein [Spirochaetales bacterium]
MIYVIYSLDSAILNIFSHVPHIFILDQIMFFFTTIGKIGAVWIIITLILLFKKKYRDAGIITAAALIFSLIIINISLKPFIQRPRPYTENKEIILKINPPIEYSFPSGHTSSSFAAAIALTLMLRKKRISIIVLVAALLISFSRIYFNVHYTSDIIAGMFFGFLCGFGAWLLRKIIIKVFPESLFDTSKQGDNR